MHKKKRETDDLMVHARGQWAASGAADWLSVESTPLVKSYGTQP